MLSACVEVQRMRRCLAPANFQPFWTYLFWHTAAAKCRRHYTASPRNYLHGLGEFLLQTNVWQQIDISKTAVKSQQNS